MSPIISIVIPSLNTAKFIEQCLISVVSQTIKDIEIICVDAGSTDGTLEIIKKFSANDKRIKVIHSNIRSYGYQINLGLDSSNGKYLGIVEPDDYIDNNAFDSLIKIAEKRNADIVKAQWYNHSDNFEYKMNIVPDFVYEKCINPVSSFKHPLLTAYLFDLPAAIWSGIYRIDFLKNNHILFNETPGASFQDTGFYFKALLCANRCVFVKDCYLHYRIDNTSSSVYSESKDLCICDEIQDINNFLDNASLFKNNKKIRYILSRFIYTKYKWNLQRISANTKSVSKFKLILKEQLIQLKTYNRLNKKYFDRKDWLSVLSLVDDVGIRANRKLIIVIKDIFWYFKYGGIKFCLWKIKKRVENSKHE